MFWSDGSFERGEAFGAHEALFRRLEDASSAFQAKVGGDAELEALERLWRELNERLEIYEEGKPVPLRDVGLHLTGERASIRY